MMLIITLFESYRQIKPSSVQAHHSVKLGQTGASQK